MLNFTFLIKNEGIEYYKSQNSLSPIWKPMLEFKHSRVQTGIKICYKTFMFGLKSEKKVRAILPNMQTSTLC